MTEAPAAKHEVIIRLTRLEAQGLYRLADEGAKDTLTDDVTAFDCIGDACAIKAAERALDKLRDASREAQETEA